MAGINNIDYREYSPRLKFRNNMENKEQNIGMTSDQDYPISIREFMWEEFCKKFPNQETTNLSLFQVFKLGFRSGASWQSSQPINSGWVSVETIEDLPIEDCRYWIANKNGVFDFLANKEQVKAKFSNGTLTHYKKVDEPSPPKP